MSERPEPLDLTKTQSISANTATLTVSPLKLSIVESQILLDVEYRPFAVRV